MRIWDDSKAVARWRKVKKNRLPLADSRNRSAIELKRHQAAAAALAQNNDFDVVGAPTLEMRGINYLFGRNERHSHPARSFAVGAASHD